MPLTVRDIEEVLSRHPFLKPPKRIFILEAPIVYPELKALVHGLNPTFERETIILSSTATEETLIHETLHRMMLGEVLSYPLAKRLLRFREKFPPIVKRRIKYSERTLTSEEMEKYGLRAYEWVNGYAVKKEINLKELTLEEYE